MPDRSPSGWPTRASASAPRTAAQSYLNIPQLIAAAEVTDAEAIHPGYGFLAENATFAEICRACSIRFIGPSPEVIRLLGDKVRARELARKADVPLLPGSDGAVRDEAEARSVADTLGYPVLLKASLGGGGRGIRIVWDVDSLAHGRADLPERGGGGVRILGDLSGAATWMARATSRCRCWPTAAATSSTWVSGTAPSSAGTRSFWRRRRARGWRTRPAGS